MQLVQCIKVVKFDFHRVEAPKEHQFIEYIIGGAEVYHLRPRLKSMAEGDNSGNLSPCSLESKNSIHISSANPRTADLFSRVDGQRTTAGKGISEMGTRMACCEVAVGALMKRK